MRPVAVTRVTLNDDVYVTEATVCGDILCLASTDECVRLFAAATGSYVRTLEGHTAPITDLVPLHGALGLSVVGTNAAATAGSSDGGSVLISAQRDCGVMFTDLRQQRPAHFLTELQGKGDDCFSVCASPSGTRIAMSTGGTVHIIDTRTFSSLRTLPETHTDDISRMRFYSEHVLVSGGEDQMLNFTAIDAAKEGDLLLCASMMGAAATRIAVFPDDALARANHSSGSGVPVPPLHAAAAIGSSEDACVQGVPGSVAATGSLVGADGVEMDFPNEIKIKRLALNVYNVDFLSFDGNMLLVTGRHEEEFDDWTAGQASRAQWAATEGGASGAEHAPLVVNQTTGRYVFPGDLADAAESVTAEQTAARRAANPIGEVQARMQHGGASPNGRPLTVHIVGPRGIADPNDPATNRQLAPVHSGVVRVMLPLGGGSSRVVSAGEDGVVAFWDFARLNDPTDGPSPASTTLSSRSSTHSGKARTAPRAAATAANPMGDGSRRPFAGRR